jgi:glycosyltransferase involved in cell wall biosynthesis
MKVLHGPVNVGNQPWALSRAERRLGIASDLVVRSGTWLNYPADKTLSRDGSSFLEIAVRSVLFGLGVPWKYDVLHFYFGQTFLSPGRSFLKSPLLSRIYDYFSTVDLRVARLFGRKRFMTLQGCDARLAGEGNLRNDWTMCATGRCSLYQTCIEALDARRRHMISEVLPFFDRVFYLNPELGHVVPKGQFLPYASVEIEKFCVRLPSPEGRPTIVHAPSDGSIKGTPMILGALEQLKARYDFDLVLVEKKTHEEALAVYRSADIAIDQVLAGWYGGFAVEMMAMGKPVACYIREQDMKFVPQAMRDDLPILRINPGRLVDDLAAILERRAEWQDAGKRSRRYVERWHNPDHIAKAMLDAYRSSDSAFVLTPVVAN